ncbi:MAG: hypothetical protein ACOY45_04810 [Pseudomonadota bacterium]
MVKQPLTSCLTGQIRKRAVNLSAMNSALALAKPRHGHPFRQAYFDTRRAARARAENTDLKLFALSFTAFFICFYTFIA